MAAMNPYLSIVVPVFNEEENLPELLPRLAAALAGIGKSYEVVLVNDGSRDRSLELLRDAAARDPHLVVIDFNRNYGQHSAVFAGFEEARGEIIVTLDADLQNPPEEIGKLVAKMREGHDYVGTIRRMRQDSWFRRNASRAMNLVREKITSVRMTDQGCMLRAYGRDIVDTVNRCTEANTFVPALAYTFALRPTEIEVAHEERAAGESKYSVFKLIRLNFDLVTGFSLVPLQLMSYSGILLALASGALFLYLMVQRFVEGAQVQGVFTLFAITFFLLGVVLFSIGLLGEYIGRIYEQVRGRPRYLVQAVLQDLPAPPGVFVPHATATPGASAAATHRAQTVSPEAP